MATRTINGMYVKKDTTVITRHRERHALASCSIWGSSIVTPFSVSTSPAILVVGTRRKSPAIHQTGNNKKPKKKHHACIGEPGSSSVANRSPHGVSSGFFGGLRGSRIWNLVDLLMDGACGDMYALIGIEAWDIDERRSCFLIVLGVGG